MEKYKLDENELEGLDYALIDIEKDFNCSLDDSFNENTIDGICDYLIMKLNVKYKNVESCTSQYTFYKLRNSLLELNIIKSKEELTPDTDLKILFPRKNRKRQIQKLQEKFNFDLNILTGIPIIYYISFLSGIISIITLIILFTTNQSKLSYYLIGVYSFIFSIIISRANNKYGKEIEFKNTRELIEKITRENYLHIITDKNTINKKELKNILFDRFSVELCLDKEKLKNAYF